ncbi:MAG: Y-family DNA polymerase [Paludibacteraceae bacterium]
MFGLLDCNNFYASCERVFNPSLNGKPVVVLSNNDGCVIARSQEAKAIGIPMGEPAYKLEKLMEKNHVHVFSSNYVLYGDMSRRVMETLAREVPEIEIYSIDEAFLHLDNIPNLENFGRSLVGGIKLGIGIPTSLGVASTKTLAKLANHFAKKYPGYRDVCIIDTDLKREKALKKIPVDEVWGIGRRISRRLNYYSITTAWDFTQKTKSWVRSKLGVNGERIWSELRGIPCIEMNQPSARKTICTSRSFGERLTELNPISEAVSSFASMCGEKLRKDRSYANSLLVFLHTNPFDTSQPVYYNQQLLQLPSPTNDSGELIHYARIGLEKIFVPGYKYKKAGVIVMDIVPERPLQMTLFDNRDRDKYNRAMEAMDKINSQYGRYHLKMCSQGFDKKWKLKNEKLSPCYTTSLKDVIVVNADKG